MTRRHLAKCVPLLGDFRCARCGPPNLANGKLPAGNSAHPLEVASIPLRQKAVGVSRLSFGRGRRQTLSLKLPVGNLVGPLVNDLLTENFLRSPPESGDIDTEQSAIRSFFRAYVGQPCR